VNVPALARMATTNNLIPTVADEVPSKKYGQEDLKGPRHNEDAR
jgi:hypothetical protein